MKGPSFPRIARHLNYRRSFPTPTSAVVHIPNLPYEAFDNTGTKIQPWNLLRLFESVRAYSFWEGVSSDHPEKSMFDMFKIYQNNNVFIIGTQTKIQKSFHDIEMPKFPLYVSTYLKSFGKSSKTVSYELRHTGSGTLYVTSDVTDVLVSKTTRKPVKYPDWWTEKYAPLIGDKKTVLPEMHSQQEGVITGVTVHHSDTDTHNHTNWSSYVKFCNDSIHSNVQASKYSKISQAHLDSGIQAFDVVYKGESRLGDTLSVHSWDGDSNENVIDLVITKGDLMCVYSRFTFF